MWYIFREDRWYALLGGQNLKFGFGGSTAILQENSLIHSWMDLLQYRAHHCLAYQAQQLF